MAHIKTFCRVKPCPRNYDDYDTTNTTVYIRVPEHLNPVSWGVHVRAKKSVINHEFKFNGIFKETVSQSEVFNTTAKSIVEGFLNGYNGTIFAYGQTGTGKTYTVEGGARKYQDRGIAPRALSLIYSSLASRTDEDIDVHVSYMEIYQEIGYDLLNTAARTASLVTPFPKVAVVEGAKGSCIIRNLSTHLAANENVAQQLLLQGQANRKVAETPMNQRSSRSHAVFTIYLTAKKQDSDLIVKSKLHLVDLAGSERVSKTGIVGLQLSEAKFINLSLHHLEGVIIALQKEVTGGQSRAVERRPASANTALDYKLYNRWVNTMRSSTPAPNVSKFVPYRNSLLTMVLRDSLGGNCQTAMIATISMEVGNLSESISTCRFAQRVACVTNTLSKNEEIDDKSMIRRLRKKIAELETELAVLRDNQGEGVQALEYSNMDSKLTDEEKMKCATIVKAYLGGNVKDPIVAGVSSAQKFRECLRLLKKIVNSHLDNNDIAIETVFGPAAITGPRRANSTEDIARPVSAWGDNTAQQTTGVQRSLSAATLQSEVELDMYMNKQTEKPSEVCQEKPTQVLHTKQSEFCPEKPTPVFLTEQENKIGNGSFGQKSKPVNNPSVEQQLLENNSKGQKPQATNKERPSNIPIKSGSRPDSGGSIRTRPNSGGSVGKRGQSRAVSAPAHFREHHYAKPQTYKSPFERKKEQEIKRLDKKVEKAETEIQTQQRHLEDMQNDIKEQQLHILRKEVSGKFEKTSTQLADQHTYITKLQTAQADSELVEQEKLVEKQLKKRKHKMEKRLELIDQQLNIVKDENSRTKHSIEQKDQRTTKPGESKRKSSSQDLERKYSEYVKRDGKVDSKKVMDMLQSKGRKQEKLQDKLEREKMFALTTQVEIKEVATRQKLMEFREKLRQRKELGSGSSSVFDGTASESNFSITVSENRHSTPIKSTPENSLPSQSATYIDSQTGDVHFTNSTVSLQSSELTNQSLTSFGDFNAETNARSKSNTRVSQERNEERPNSGTSAVLLSQWASRSKSNFKSASTADMERLQMHSTMLSNKSTNVASKQWDNAYSTKRDPRSFEIGPALDLDNIHSNSIQFSNSTIKDLGYEDFPFSTSSHNNSQNDDENSDAESVSTVRQVTPRTNNNQNDNYNNPDPFKRSEPFQNRFFVQQSSSKPDPFAPGYFSRSLKPEVKSHKNELNDSHTGGHVEHDRTNSNLYNNGANNDCSKRRLSIPESVENITDYEKSQMLHGSRTESSQMFSRTVIDNNKENKPSGFHGNKYTSSNGAPNQTGTNFSYSKKTSNHMEPSDFDKALDKMLGMGSTSSGDQTNKPMTVRPEQYNKYARTDGKGGSKVKAGSRGQSSSSSKSKGSAQLWGPEAKNISVSERLAQYLDMESFEDSKNLMKGKSYEDTDIHPYKKPTIADDEPSKPTVGPTSEWKKKQTIGKLRPEIDVDHFRLKIKAMEEEEREETYMNTARQQRSRIQRIRQARGAAEVIQKAWRKYKYKT